MSPAIGFKGIGDKAKTDGRHHLIIVEYLYHACSTKIEVKVAPISFFVVGEFVIPGRVLSFEAAQEVLPEKLIALRLFELLTVY